MEENIIDTPSCEMPKIKVYVKLDLNKTVTAINSSIFLQDITDWMEIDEGNGDKYAHAQNNYLEKGLIDDKGRFNYKYDTELVELTEAEKEILFPPAPILPTPEEMVITEMSMSMAQMQAESNQAIAELTTVIAMLQIPMV